jgi:GH25 family lysozyme M1 (1,4-beta-N-acetylmuramidase)
MKPSSIDRFIENLKDTDYQSQPMVKDLSWEYDSEGRKTVAKKKRLKKVEHFLKKLEMLYLMQD